MGASSRKRSRKRRRTQLPEAKEEDYINELPDEVIVEHILPRLPLKEAVRSSILCQRWKNLWTLNITPKLVFSLKIVPFYLNLREEIVLKKRHKLLSGVNRILGMYSKPWLDEFSVRFDFESIYRHDVDGWLDYAFNKGVSRLELDLSPWSGYKFNKGTYTYPDYCSGMCNLKDLCLKWVRVPSNILKLLLSNCTSLQRLCIWHSYDSGDVKISGRSNNLKSLELVRCGYKTVKVKVSDLVSLNYFGSERALRLRRAPLLSELYISGAYAKAFLGSGAKNFRYVSQIKKLVLDIQNVEGDCNSIYYAMQFREFLKLEQLEVKLQAADGFCALWPILLIKAAPFLRRFSIQVHIWPDLGIDKSQGKEHLKRLRSAVKQVDHKCLKVIELHGFSNFSTELELVQYLSCVSRSLEQFVISPSRGSWLGAPEGIFGRCTERYREKAEKVINLLPPEAKAKVVVL